MKIGPELLAALQEVLDPLDTDQRRDLYRDGKFHRTDAVQDLNKRYRWDLFYAAKAYKLLPDGLSDAHIDTALRRLVPSL